MQKPLMREAETNVLPDANGTDAFFSPGRFAMFLALVLFATFPGVVLGTHTFYFRDFLTVVYPWAQYNHDAFWRGELPLWNPLSNCGAPYLAQWQTFSLYPGWWIFLPFPTSWSLGMFCLAHLFFAGMTMYFLARRWTGSAVAGCVAGIIYAFNGVTQNTFNWPYIMATLAWAPLVLLLVERAYVGGGRMVVFAALAGAMQMLTGAPEQIIFTWTIAAGIGVLFAFQNKPMWWKVVLRFGAIVLLVAALSAAQVLPFLDLIAHSQRSAEFGGGSGARPGGLSWSVPAWGWANFFVPRFGNFRTPSGVFFQSSQYLISSYYFGLAGIALCFWAILKRHNVRVLLLGCFLVVGTVLAMGEHASLYDWLQKIVPALGFMRYPAKFMFLVIMVAPLLAAYGVAQIENSREVFPRQGKQLVAILGLVLAITVFLLWLAQAFPLSPALAKHSPETWHNGIVRVAFYVIAAAALLAWHFHRQSKWRRLWIIVLLGAVWLDLQTHEAPTPNPVVARWVYDSQLVKMNSRPQFGESRALVTLATQLRFLGYQSTNAVQDVLCNRLSLLHNCNLIDRIPTVGGAQTLLSPDAAVVTDLLLTTNELRAGVADLLGVSQTSDPEKLEWRPRSGFMPLVTAGQQPIFADARSTFAAIAGASFDPRRTVYLPIEAKAECEITNAAYAKIDKPSYGAHRIEFGIESSSGAWVSVAQSYYHNWYAFVDGRPVKLWKANYGFQALEAPAGKHRVELVYRDRLFIYGASVSCLTALGSVAALVWWFRRKPLPPA